MSKMICSDVFREAMRKRQADHPFDRISAYKVRESLKNLRRESDVVASVVAYLSVQPSDRHSSMLQGCTSADRAIRLRQIPANIAHELGYNLIPAIEALALEGVPKRDVSTFIQSLNGRVTQLISNCNKIQIANNRSIKREYRRLRAGRSDLTKASKEATDVGDLTAAFCRTHGLL